MDDLWRQLKKMLINMWRFRWAGIMSAWAVALVGTVLVMLMKDTYEATARVYVNTESQLRLLLDDEIVESNVEDQLRFVRETLMGKPQLERLAKELNMVDESASTLVLQNTVQDLANRIQIISSSELGPPRPWNSRRTDDTYIIRYHHQNRELAVAVVDKLLSIFVEDTIGGKRTSSNMANQFLTEQVQDYEQRLRNAEEALAQFNRENYDRLPSLQGGYFEGLQTARDDLQTAQSDLALAESRLLSIEQQLRGESPQVLSTGDLDPNSIEARLLDARRRLDDLKLRFTDRHPDVVAAREIVKQLERQQEEFYSDTDINMASNNPVFQALQISRNEVQSEVATLEATVAQRQRRVTELQNLINEVPEVEAELARLNRDYDVIQAKYQSLLNTLEKEKLSRQVLESEQVDFRIIDPPYASADPVAPNRTLFLLAVTVACFGAGLAIAWTLAELKPVFDSSTDLESALGLQVLGTVHRHWSELEVKRFSASTIMFIASAGGLLAIMFGIVGLEYAGISVLRPS